MTASKRPRIRALGSGIVDDEAVRRLVRRGVLVPLDRAPSLPAREHVLHELRARARAHRVRPDVDDDPLGEDDDEDTGPLLDHRGRGPGDPDYGADD